LKNRHIGLQITRAATEIKKQSDNGWFVIDILSFNDNRNVNQIHSASIKIRFAKLNGDGISKWIFINTIGEVYNIGETI
jgi:hypothetical protein